MDSASESSGTQDIPKALVAMEMSLAGVIAIFGIAGNCLTIRVLGGPRLRQTSTAIYLTCLSAVDILVLLVGPSTKALSAAVFASDRHLRDLHAWLCKAQLFINYSASQISAWILVAVTIDRAVWVLRPFRARQLCTVRRAASVAAVTALAICCVNLQVLLHAQLMPRRSENSTVCHIHDPLTRHAYVSYVDPALVTVGPFLLMLIANLLIVRRLRRLKARRVASLNKRRSRARRSVRGGGSSEGNLTRMLLCTNAFYLAASLPYVLLMQLLKDQRAEIVRSPSLLNVVYLGQVFSYSLFNLSYAIHFLLYCLVGPTFKAEAFRLLGIRQRHRQQQQQPQQQLLRAPEYSEQAMEQQGGNVEQVESEQAEQQV